MFPTRVLRARSVWKGPHIVPMNIQRAAPEGTSTTTSTSTSSTSSRPGPAHKPGAAGSTQGTPASRIPPVRTQARAATILPNFVGMRFQVHNGKTYQEVLITEDMVGCKLGEFALTRKPFSYKQSKNK